MKKKKYILITFMIITLLLTGCGNDNVKEENGDLGKDNNVGLETPGSSSNQEGENQEGDEGNTVTDKHDVSFYLFYMSSCQYCHEEREWIASIQADYPYVDFKMYEVSENEELYEKVRNAYNIESTNIPLTIIGNDYFIGYTSSKNRKFLRYVEDLATFDNCDVVDAIINGEDVKACVAQNEKEE